MRLLLDAPVVLWLLTDSARLSPGDRALIGSQEAECYVRVASWWELAMKQSRGVMIDRVGG
jgi:PIN domain nuclease of toxin-antitoxin system